MSDNIPIKCPCCGASRNLTMAECVYCGAQFTTMQRLPQTPRIVPPMPKPHVMKIGVR